MSTLTDRREIDVALEFMELMHGPGISGSMKDAALETAERIMHQQTAEIERLRSVLEDYASGYPCPDKADEALAEKDDD